MVWRSWVVGVLFLLIIWVVVLPRFFEIHFKAFIITIHMREMYIVMAKRVYIQKSRMS